MMRSFSILILVLVFGNLIIHGCAKPEKQQTEQQGVVAKRNYPFWAKIYNISGQDALYSIRQTTDGGYIAAGRTNFRQGYPDAFIMRLDSGGKVQWQRGFGERYQDEFYDVQQTGDGGYLAIGKTLAIGTTAEAGARQAMIIKLDAQGAVQWQQLIPHQIFQSFTQTMDGDFVMTGTSSSFGENRTALVVAKFGLDGKNKWQKMYGDGQGTFIQRVLDGGFVVLASVWGLGHYETLILKLDPVGVMQWQRQYRGSLTSFQQMNDGGYLFAGTISVSNDKSEEREINFGPAILFGRRDVKTRGWLLKVDRDGYSQWQKTYGGMYDDEFSVVQKNLDEKVLILGVTRSYGAGNGDLWLLKVDETGTVLWQKTIGGAQREKATDILLTTDGGIIITGITGSFGRGQENPCLIKVNDAGDIPDCPQQLFGVSSALPQEVLVLRSDRNFQGSGQDISLATNSAVIPSFDMQVYPASICPPEPKVIISLPMIKLGPTSKNTTNRYQMRILNGGAVDLVIEGMKITRRKSKHVGSFSIRNVWTMITGRNRTHELFSVENTCTILAPGRDCSFIVVFRSPTSGEKQADLEIISNDPDTPVLTVPINATVR